MHIPNYMLWSLACTRLSHLFQDSWFCSDKGVFLLLKISMREQCDWQL